MDVNIHPAKKEVKLFDSHYIDRLILGLAEKALNREHRVDGGLFTPATPHVTRRNLCRGRAD